jgi:hypothetical protein
MKEGNALYFPSFFFISCKNNILFVNTQRDAYTKQLLFLLYFQKYIYILFFSIFFVFVSALKK